MWQTYTFKDSQKVFKRESVKLNKRVNWGSILDWALV